MRRSVKTYHFRGYCLDEHRPYSKKYIEDSTIYVKTKFARRILQVGLLFIRTERPVYVKVI
jgi:hypothetical protein